MGVLAGRIPRKVNEGYLVEVKTKLTGLAKNFITYAGNYGIVLAGQEEQFYKEAPGFGIIGALERYGVDACCRGADFWQSKR